MVPGHLHLHPVPPSMDPPQSIRSLRMGTTTPALVLATLLCVHLAIAFRIETSGSVGSIEEGGQHPVFVEVNSVNSEGTLGEDEEGVKIKSVIPVLKQGLQQVGG